MLRRIFAGLLAVVIVGPVMGVDDEIVVLDAMKSKAPAAWSKQKPTTGTRRYQFKIEKAAGEPEDTEIIISHFGKGQGGSEDANIKRWKGMFKDPAGDKAKLEKFKVGDVPVTLLDIAGTFISKPPG